MEFRGNLRSAGRFGGCLILSLALAGCGGFGSGGGGSIGSGNIFGGGRAKAEPARERAGAVAETETRQSTIWDLFSNANDPNTTVEVNKYLWQASLEVLNFLPIQSVDPFSGVIVTGFGSPPGGGGAYRATIYVQDPALDARSLKVALVGRGGPVDADTQRAVEDAILTRARQLRIRDSKL
jgi:hypothetical protein